MSNQFEAEQRRKGISKSIADIKASDVNVSASDMEMLASGIATASSDMDISVYIL
jgi:hypothetical protein